MYNTLINEESIPVSLLKLHARQNLLSFFFAWQYPFLCEDDHSTSLMVFI